MNRTEYTNIISAIFGTRDVDLIEVAYLLSKKFHKGQFRKEMDSAGKPLRYFEHPRRVSLILIQELGCVDYRAIVVALLHDTIEDSEDKVLISRLAEELFTESVLESIQILTKSVKEGYWERFYEYMDGTHPITYIPVLVKMADRLDNLRSLPDDQKFRDKQKKETQEVLMPLFHKAIDTAPGKQLKAQLQKGVQLIQVELDKL